MSKNVPNVPLPPQFEQVCKLIRQAHDRYQRNKISLNHTFIIGISLIGIMCIGTEAFELFSLLSFLMGIGWASLRIFNRFVYLRLRHKLEELVRELRAQLAEQGAEEITAASTGELLGR